MSFRTQVRNLVIVCSLFYSSSLIAQTGNDKLKNEEINIEGEFNPVISDAAKISSSPVITDTTTKKVNVKYPLLNKTVPVAFETEPILPAKLKSEPVLKLYRHYAKLGIGTYTTPLAEYYLNSLRSRLGNYGLYLKHLSTRGGIKDVGHSGFSRNSAGVFGKTFINKHTLSGAFDYKREVVHYYGVVAGTFGPYIENWVSPRQRYNLFSVNTNLKSNYTDSSLLNHNISIDYYNLSTLDLASESNVRTDVKLSKFFEKELFAVNTTVDFYRSQYDFKNIDHFFDKVNSALIKVNPEVLSRGNRWNLKAGLNIFVEMMTDEVSKFHFYPNVDFNYNVIDNIIIPFAGINGRMERNSFKRAVDVNPFVMPFLNLGNTNYKWNAYGGLRGTFGSDISYTTYVSYAEVENMPFFVNRGRYGNEFFYVYDTGNVLNFHGELAYQATEKLKLLTKADYYQYDLNNQEYPWHKPGFELTITGNYSLRDKIILRADVFYIGERFAKNVNREEPDDINAIRLNPVTDVNLGIEYRYTKKLSAFVNFNNIGAARYYRWHNYPTQRFSVLGGFTFSF